MTQKTDTEELNESKHHQNKNIESKHQKVQELRKWMIERGCLIHKNVQIPSFVNGVQGVATKQPIPSKTLILAVPSSLILTVSKCYKDPQIKNIFKKNQQLFDYESSEDAQFNILCVFLMYHKMNNQTSPWRIYLQTIGEPQTAIDWQNSMLKGLNKSLIEQILHVRIQCDKLKDVLSQFLKNNTEQFKNYDLDQIKQCFNYCYRAVMTRCFGYYFGEASLIPVADLINHGCEAVDHQLINLKYEKGYQFNQAYKQKSDKIDCSLLGIKKGSNIQHPFRERFLLQNGLIQNSLETLCKLNRDAIDNKIYDFNQKLFSTQQNTDIDHIQFCEENDQEDNDTDEEQQNQREIQLQRLKTQQLEQIQNFKKYFESVKVQTYKQVQDRYDQYERLLLAKSDPKGKDKGDENPPQTKQSQSSTVQSKNDMFIKADQSVSKRQNSNKQGTSDEKLMFEDESIFFSKRSDLQKGILTQKYQSPKQQINQYKNEKNVRLKESIQQKAVVPIQMIDESQSQSQDDEQWGLQPDSYFTMSTSSAVQGKKQLFNSYGSRTNKFLLIWYGFCYRNNLYDSVTLRLHVQFNPELANANDIVLDTYIGGQGRSFRKNDKQLVKANEVSKQFRIKRNGLCLKLMTFLRLYLLQNYKGIDLYKICVTIPSSVQYQIFLMNYYKDIVGSLYSRYLTQVIEQLKQDQISQKTLEEDRQKVRFKIIYLEQQRNILDAHADTVECAINVLKRIKDLKDFKKDMNKDNDNRQVPESLFSKRLYSDFTIRQLRNLKPYLTILKNNFSYMMHEQQDKN